MSDDLFEDLDAKYGGRTVAIEDIVPDTEEDERITRILAGVEDPPPCQTYSRAGQDSPADDDEPEPLETGLTGLEAAIEPVSTRWGTYTGRRLVPGRSTCGWCSTRHCGECRTWLSSPGSDPAKLDNGRMPCIHPCDEEKLVYLRSIFGVGWEPTHSMPDTHIPVLRITGPSSSVSAVKVLPTDTQEVAVSDTTTEAPVEPTSEPFEYPTGEGSTPEPEVEVAVPAEPAAEAAPVEAAAEATEKPARAKSVDLEPDVKAVTDAFVTGSLTLGEGDYLTPHRIAKAIGEKRSGKSPSTGAVSSVLDRWVKYGFATVNDKPKAFLDYTDEGRDKGLSAMKAQHREAARAARGTTATPAADGADAS